MELRQLQHFVAVAEEKHFTRAARRVNIVQSALSASVRSLEQELGASLFARSTRQVRLTAAGEAFLEKALAALDAVRDARDVVASVQGLKRGSLSIGAVESLPAFIDLPSILARFHASHPAIDVRLRQGSAQELLEKVRAGRLDVAFLPLCEPAGDVSAKMIACEELVLACAPGHPLAGREGLSLAELQDEPFVDFATEWGTRQLLDRSFFAAGLERRTTFEVSDLQTLLDLVQRGLGVALVPEAIALTRGASLGIGYLAPPEICWELVAIYAASARDEAPKAFLELLADVS
jgi:DNA-binding transcriptional LysR family regulator